LATINKYKYTINGSTYTIDPINTINHSSDICDLLENIDIHNEKPLFILPALNSKLIAISISTRLLNIKVNKQSIENTGDIVWTWNSGLNTGIISNGSLAVNYDDGRLVKNGQVLDSLHADPLTKGNLYYLTIWAWDDNGKQILYSSPSMPFLIGTHLYNYDNYDFLGKDVSDDVSSLIFTTKTWRLDTAIDLQSNRSITDSFPIKSFSLQTQCQQSKGPSTTHLIYSDAFDSTGVHFIDNTAFTLDHHPVIKSQVNLLFVCPEKLIVQTAISNRPTELIYSLR